MKNNTSSIESSRATRLASIVTIGAIAVASWVEIAGLMEVAGRDASLAKQVGLVGIALVISISNYLLQALAGHRYGYSSFAEPKAEEAARILFRKKLGQADFKALNTNIQRLNQLPVEIVGDEAALKAAKLDLDQLRSMHKADLASFASRIDSVLRQPSKNFSSWPEDERLLFAQLSEQYRQKLRDLRAFESAEERHREDAP